MMLEKAEFLVELKRLEHASYVLNDDYSRRMLKQYIQDVEFERFQDRRRGLQVSI